MINWNRIYIFLMNFFGNLTRKAFNHEITYRFGYKLAKVSNYFWEKHSSEDPYCNCNDCIDGIVCKVPDDWYNNDEWIDPNELDDFNHARR